MPNWMKLAGGWGVAAIVAVTFSWGAVAQVRNQVIQPSIEIPTTVAAGTSTGVAVTTTTVAPPTVIRVEPEIDSETPTTATQPRPDATSSTAAPPATTAQSNGAPTTTTTQPPSTTATTTTPPTTTQPPATTSTTTTTAPPEEQTSSYQLIGGTVTISYSPGVVTFVTAIPQAGFSTELRETGPDRVRVRFESENHTSDFRAEWDGDEFAIVENETGGN